MCCMVVAAEGRGVSQDRDTLVQESAELAAPGRVDLGGEKERKGKDKHGAGNGGGDLFVMSGLITDLSACYVDIR